MQVYSDWNFAICSPDVNELLKTMPSLSQPAPPPGIPAGIPPMRKADATGAQVPCKHFAMGNCTRGDKCEYAHETDQPGKAHITGRNVARKRGGPRETPPVGTVPLALSVDIFFFRQDTVNLF